MAWKSKFAADPRLLCSFFLYACFIGEMSFMSETAPKAPVSSSGLSKGPWPILTILEQRLLGVLIEKQKTTPEVYPLSQNALTVGSNQKSNRDPVMNLNDEEVMDVIDSLRSKSLAIKVTGGRVDRYRHLLYDVLLVSKPEMAIIGELFLRGPQTEGELRTRASRMEEIADLDALRGHLRELKERNLVVYLTAEDRRGAIVAHNLYKSADLEALRRRAEGMASNVASGESSSQGRSGAGVSAEVLPLIEHLGAKVEQLGAKVDQLQNRVASLEKELDGLKQALGQ